MTIRLLTLLFALALYFTALGQAPISLRVLHAPSPVIIDGKPMIYYELVVTNATEVPRALKSLAVVNTAGSSVMRAFGPGDLAGRYAALPPAQPAQDLTLAPSASGLIYIELTLPASAASNLQLVHLVETVDTGTGQPATLPGGNLALQTQAPIVLGQPLRGGPWAAVYEASWPRGHRRVAYAVDGNPHIPGRFAIDFLLLGPEGTLASGDKNIILNWHGYAADVLAVSDGVITAVRNDFAESSTLSAHPAHPPEKAMGNYIVLDIGNGCYVFYEHLKPQSIAVKVGQTVKKGERLAALGFTGQTTGPHLHLHVADRNSPLGAEGLPFVFERFSLLGTYPGAQGLGERPWLPAKTGNSSVVQQRPGANAVIGFP